MADGPVLAVELGEPATPVVVDEVLVTELPELAVPVQVTLVAGSQPEQARGPDRLGRLPEEALLHDRTTLPIDGVDKAAGTEPTLIHGSVEEGLRRLGQPRVIHALRGDLQA